MWKTTTENRTENLEQFSVFFSVLFCLIRITTTTTMLKVNMGLSGNYVK